MELISETEKATLLTTRETRGRKKPLNPTPKKVSDFERMRDLFFNRSPEHHAMEVTTVRNRVTFPLTPSSMEVAAVENRATSNSGLCVRAAMVVIRGIHTSTLREQVRRWRASKLV